MKIQRQVQGYFSVFIEMNHLNLKYQWFIPKYGAIKNLSLWQTQFLCLMILNYIVCASFKSF